jgi:hypothetical protein
MYSANWTGKRSAGTYREGGKRCPLVSPASPENAIKVCLFNARVLSSDALRIVAPLIAAFEAAMRVKSLPVMPSKTSLLLPELA